MKKTSAGEQLTPCLVHEGKGAADGAEDKETLRLGEDGDGLLLQPQEAAQPQVLVHHVLAHWHPGHQVAPGCPGDSLPG